MRAAALVALLVVIPAISTLVLRASPAHAGSNPPTCAGVNGGNLADELTPGQTLTAGNCLTDPAWNYQLLMQTDGNLVLSFISTGQVLWSTNTGGNTDAYLELTSNGMLAVFGRGVPDTGTPLWSAPGTAGYPQDMLIMSTNGNAEVGYPNPNPTVLGPKNILLWSTGIQAIAQSSTLLAGATLASGQSLVSGSGNGGYTLVMQTDGNLVLVDDKVINPSTGLYGVPIWWTGTQNNPGATVTLQTDGNLVVYSNAGNPLWSSGTPGSASNLLLVQTDGNLVLYHAVSATDYTAIWDTRTNGFSGYSMDTGQQLTSGQYLASPSQQYILLLQSDGNLVEYYTPTRSVLLATNTAGNPGDRLYFQGSNLVVYSSKDAVLWQSGTGSTTASELQLQDDGNLVLYNTTGLPVWESGTYHYRTDAILAGQSLAPGDYLSSANGQYRLFNSPTQGTMWLYQASTPPDCPLWQQPAYTQTQVGNQINYYPTGTAQSTMSMQADGNLVVTGPGGNVIWQSGTAGTAGGYSLVLQNDGNLVIYNAAEQAIWSSNTEIVRGPALCEGSTLDEGQYLVTPNGQYTMDMQNDCNLVIYKASGGSAWASDTDVSQAGEGKNPLTPGLDYSGCYLTMQADGNLVMYGPNLPSGSQAIWASGTSGTPGAISLLQEDGYLQVWASNQVTLLTTEPPVPNFVLREQNRAGTQLAGSLIRNLVKAALG